MLQIAPPDVDAEPIELTDELPSGQICLLLLPKSRDVQDTRLAGDATVTTFDNSVSRIRYAIRRKRRQVRSSTLPVLLAIHASGMSSDFEDFDRALYGHSYESYNANHQLVERGFHPDGEFSRPGGSEPTYAGVLAFLHVGFSACTEPVLYLHPRFQGTLPKEVVQLEQRIFRPVAKTIESKVSSVTGFLEGLDFVRVE